MGESKHPCPTCSRAPGGKHATNCPRYAAANGARQLKLDEAVKAEMSRIAGERARVEIVTRQQAIDRLATVVSGGDEVVFDEPCGISQEMYDEAMRGDE